MATFWIDRYLDRQLLGRCCNPVILAFGAVVVIELVFLSTTNAAVTLAGEDGSFYVQIAKNMAEGKGITFDGIVPTTGVHYGWLFLLAAVFKFVGVGSSWLLFRSAAVSYFLLLIAAGVVIYRLTPLGSLFMVVYLANRGHWYMETNLVLLMLAIAIRWPGWLSGFALVLSRADLVLLALFTGRLRLVAGAAAGFAGVCALNIMVDGNPVSVSAQIKSYGWNDWDTIWRASRHLAVYYPVLPVMWLLAWLSVDRWFLAANALLLVHLLHNSETEGWYLAPLFLTSLLCADRVVRLYGPRLCEQFRLVGLSGVRP